MIYNNIIKGTSVEAIWEQIVNDFAANPDALDYRVLTELNDRKILLSIDIDPGGGFESGFETTLITSPVPRNHSKYFSIHHEGFLDELGKFLGMQDIQIGYAEFDKQIIVKGEDDDFIKTLFSDKNVRDAFKDLRSFSFGVVEQALVDAQEKGALLEFEIEKAIINPAQLLSLYKAYVTVLDFF